MRSSGIVMYAWLIALCIPFVSPLEAGQKSLSNKWIMLDGDIGEWTKREEVDRRLARIKEAGFTVYMPVVWYGKGTTWPSTLAPWDPETAVSRKESPDPLRYMIERAHQMGLEVHPWFTVSFRWNDSYFPEYALPGGGEGPHAAFNIHNAAFREFISGLVAEVVTNYDVDGVNLDFVRAIGLCRTTACERSYELKFGRDLAMDSLMSKVAPMKVPTLLTFQEEAVTTVVKTISDVIRRRRPNVIISVDAHPELSRSPNFALQGQNSIDWANKGLVDAVLRMDYHPAISVESIHAVRGQLKNPDVLAHLISNMSHGADLNEDQKPVARSGQWLVATASMIQARWPGSGIAVYFYKYLSNDQIAAFRGWQIPRRDAP